MTEFRLCVVEYLLCLAIRLVPKERPEASLLAACLSRYIDLATGLKKEGA